MKYLFKCLKVSFGVLLFSSSQGWAGEVLSLAGGTLGLEWVIPFGGLLLSIALMPLLRPHFWHHHYGKVGMIWALSTAILLGKNFGLLTMVESLGLTLIHHYMPFMMMIGALYIIAGGIRLDIQASSTPILNTSILGIGALFASLIGTTGASMLLIQPFLTLNKERQFRRHLVVFFIILVCNVGGALSPIGDPPLLIGFLKGVPFLWPLIHLFKPFLLILSSVLVIFYVVDRRLLAQEGRSLRKITTAKFSLHGYDNVVLLGLAISCLFLSELTYFKSSLRLFGMTFSQGDLMRDLGLLGLAFISLKFCRQNARIENQFTWEPLKEVALLFGAIFITVEPVLAMLKAGKEGAFSGLYQFLVDSQGQPLNNSYFWLTGFLSSFLDNAPTYLIFFNLAGGDVTTLTTELSSTLMAISAGAVFMGALTYIGNAPNFMVKSIAETNSIEMPNFFSYTFWVSLILLPLFVVISFVFFS
ncbi:MAG: sodium:proton antiporter [Candidatus Paracaedimonas acanthamoebae]|uniref:Sodium:proton antiporter n=1 Tax=Candidatus Paracaedimonas acanthamoebae TaxID=244581 RepID=A0A8J7TVS8_9PROT|nr:sodium:proton antiporter [Candidatus Paracaedimonas acanthamoebae]